MAVRVLSGVDQVTSGKGVGHSTSTAIWTFALYVNGANSLAKHWAQDSLPFLVNVPASAQVNAVALGSLKNGTNDCVENISDSTVACARTFAHLRTGVKRQRSMEPP